MDKSDADVQFRFDEERNIKEVLEYILSTYGEHYAHDLNNRGMQLFDLWEGMGIVVPTCQATAIKYLTRYGRKGGYNKKDLMKAMHYILLLWFYTQRDNINIPEVVNQGVPSDENMLEVQPTERAGSVPSR